ncbi:MAG TPA: erythromycin esterase family protein [Longimicrobium sp.]|nr:erythromycin esterase family protein [Longimicrobium sp.]
MMHIPASIRDSGRSLGLAALLGLLVGPAEARAQWADSSTVEARVSEAVCDREVVVLGELPSHGEARAFQAKARIVQRLVERCGFDAVLFEAPIYDFLGFQAAVAERRAAPAQLDKAIGRFWWTRELADWRRWLFGQATAGRLVLAGLDDQVSAMSDHARATLPALVAASLPARSAAECEQAIVRNLYWRYDAARPFNEPERIRLQRCARRAADARAARGRRGAGTPESVMLENLAGFYDREQGAAGARDRDAMMYRNFLWQRARMPRGSKLIVWTATVHAARRQGPLPAKPLGAWLAEHRGDRLAVIGFSAFGGQSSMAGMPSKPLPEAPPGSLEAQATGGGTAMAFLDASALRRIGNAPSRLFGSFASVDWSAYFDGVVVVREEVAPVFEPWR